MILSDVVPVLNTKAPANKKPYKEVEGLSENFINGLGFLQSLQSTYEEKNALTSLAKRGVDHLDDKLVGIALREGITEVPDVIRNQNSAGAKIAQTPQASLEDLRKIADLLGFLIMPFEYLHKESYSRESGLMQSSINEFSSKIGKWFTPYVLSPPIFYDVEKHVSSDSDLPVYSGPLTAQAMMALSMSLPMFRSILRNLKSLSRDNVEIRNQIAGVQNEIVGIKTRLVALEAYVEQQIQIKIQEEVQRKKEAEAAAERARLIEYEPMLIGIPKGSTVNSDCRVIIGPCWGPDFQDIVFTALHLKKIEGQRKLLADKAQMFAVRGMYY